MPLCRLYGYWRTESDLQVSMLSLLFHEDTFHLQFLFCFHDKGSCVVLKQSQSSTHRNQSSADSQQHIPVGFPALHRISFQFHYKPGVLSDNAVRDTPSSFIIGDSQIFLRFVRLHSVVEFHRSQNGYFLSSRLGQIKGEVGIFYAKPLGVENIFPIAFQVGVFICTDFREYLSSIPRRWRKYHIREKSQLVLGNPSILAGDRRRKDHRGCIQLHSHSVFGHHILGKFYGNIGGPHYLAAGCKGLHYHRYFATR